MDDKILKFKVLPKYVPLVLQIEELIRDYEPEMNFGEACGVLEIVKFNMLITWRET